MIATTISVVIPAAAPAILAAAATVTHRALLRRNATTRALRWPSDGPVGDAIPARSKSAGSTPGAHEVSGS